MASLIVSPYSQEEFPLRLEKWYTLFLMIDMSSYGHVDGFSGGCVKIRMEAFFLNPIWPPPRPLFREMSITLNVLVIET